jgi:hypothetical protein
LRIRAEQKETLNRWSGDQEHKRFALDKTIGILDGDSPKSGDELKATEIRPRLQSIWHIGDEAPALR